MFRLFIININIIIIIVIIIFNSFSFNMFVCFFVRYGRDNNAGTQTGRKFSLGEVEGSLEIHLLVLIAKYSAK